MHSTSKALELGEAIANALQLIFPDATIITANDRAQVIEPSEAIGRRVKALLKLN